MNGTTMKEATMKEATIKRTTIKRATMKRATMKRTTIKRTSILSLRKRIYTLITRGVRRYLGSMIALTDSI